MTANNNYNSDSQKFYKINKLKPRNKLLNLRFEFDIVRF